MDKMKNLIAIKPQTTPYISLTWQVNNFCNYQCSYCNPGNWQGNLKNEDRLDIIQKNLDKIFSYYELKEYRAFKFYFSGGEPTNWKTLIPLIKWLKERLDDPHIGINTNMSRPLSYWKENYQYFHDIVASFHIEFAKKDRYIENVIFLQDKVNYLCCRMMMQEERFLEVRDFGYHLRSILENYNIEWVPLFDDISTNVGPWDYKEEWKKDFFKDHNFETQIKLPNPDGSKWKPVMLEVYDDGTEQVFNGNRLTANRLNFFKGWKCAVSEGIFINSSGNVTAASCGQGPYIGNIFDEIELNLEPVICKKTQCTCGTDMLLTKEKI